MKAPVKCRYSCRVAEIVSHRTNSLDLAVPGCPLPTSGSVKFMFVQLKKEITCFYLLWLCQVNNVLKSCQLEMNCPPTYKWSPISINSGLIIICKMKYYSDR